MPRVPASAGLSAPREPHVYTVAELTSLVREMLESRFPFISVAGEISNLRRPRSGHIYFTLKDDRAQIRAVLFRMQQRYLEREPADGQMVVCRGRITVYEPRGDYQLIVDALDFHGAGALQLAFEQLKKKLAAEGLFDEHLKKAIPPIPAHITLVTSPSGAAVHDFLRVASSRYPATRIGVYPVAVQGDTAADEMVAALERINESLATDVIVLCRGGGSIEDLWAFNEERLARAIHASRLPVVSAVGHEIDFTIADFAADLRAPTPSAAAEMLLPDGRELWQRVAGAHERLARAMRERLQRLQEQLVFLRRRLGTMGHPLESLALRLDHASLSLERAMLGFLESREHSLAAWSGRLEQKSPAARLELHRQRLAALRQRLLLAGPALVDARGRELARLAALLEAVSPLSTLARGYAIVRKEERPAGMILTDSREVRAGDRLEVLLHRGRLHCTVESTEEEQGKEISRGSRQAPG
ncbi:exodeoxyribonuclease VII large subunit [Thermodesulfobacteriota bacterium B35]